MSRVQNCFVPLVLPSKDGAGLAEEKNSRDKAKPSASCGSTCRGCSTGGAPIFSRGELASLKLDALSTLTRSIRTNTDLEACRVRSGQHRLSTGLTKMEVQVLYFARTHRNGSPALTIHRSHFPKDRIRHTCSKLRAYYFIFQNEIASWTPNDHQTYLRRLVLVLPGAVLLVLPTEDEQRRRRDSTYCLSPALA